VKIRLDQLLVQRGLVPSRERARALILAGDVLVGDTPETKAGSRVDTDAPLTLRQPDHPWASRGGLKLAHALDAFGVDATGALALDVGASTGGFTDVLLQAGARRVVAVDVGRGQLDWRLRTDPRVTVLDGVNARYLTPDALPADARAFDLVTIDVSFISLRHLLPVARALVAPGGQAIVLVKPQFEAGRPDVGKGGIVRDPAVHTRVVEEVRQQAIRIGWDAVQVVPSPIEGAGGNREFLMLLRPAPDSAGVEPSA
jgi:23S rRNA (cytidine1920-2'-O)/16S rRNA (cytidine1409-2'-O)-methyltransferase